MFPDCAATATLLLITVCVQYVYTYSRHTSSYLKYRAAWNLEETALSKAGSKSGHIHGSRAGAVASAVGKRFEKTQKEKWSVVLHSANRALLCSENLPASPRTVEQRLGSPSVVWCVVKAN